MTPIAVKAALESFLATTLPTTPIAWPNVDFTPDPGVLWVCPTNKPGEAFEAEVGRDGLSRRTGAFIVQVFAPLENGSGDALEVAATVETAYRRQDIGGVECGEAYSNDIGPDGHGWYQVNVVVPWWAWIGE